MEKTNESRVNKVSHYNALPIECIDVIKYFDLPIGNVIKYCWRAGLKKEEGISQIDKEIEDLKKARYYLDCKINMLEEKKVHEELEHSPEASTIVTARTPYTNTIDGKGRVTVRMLDDEDYAEAIRNPYVSNTTRAKNEGLIPVLLYGEEMLSSGNVAAYNIGIIFAKTVDDAKAYFEAHCGKWAVCYSDLNIIVLDGGSAHSITYEYGNVEFNPDSEWRV